MSNHVFDRTKWARLTIFEQMGNIGSEVGRALSAKRRGDGAAMNGAFFRGLDLLDATVECLVEQKSSRVREVLRAREQFASAVEGVGDDGLERYFMNFALVARSGR